MRIRRKIRVGIVVVILSAISTYFIDERYTHPNPSDMLLKQMHPFVLIYLFLLSCVIFTCLMQLIGTVLGNLYFSRKRMKIQKSNSELVRYIKRIK